MLINLEKYKTGSEDLSQKRPKINPGQVPSMGKRKIWGSQTMFVTESLMQIPDIEMIPHTYFSY